MLSANEKTVAQEIKHRKKIWNKVTSTGKPFTSLSGEDSGWRTVENRDNIRDELFKTRSP